jgi:hypothetical protein
VRVFVDTNVPHPLRRELPGHDIATAQHLGWGALRNGELLRVVEDAGFEVFMSADQNPRHQQNLRGRKLAVLVLPTNHLDLLRPLVPAIQARLANIQPGDFVELPLNP